MGGEARRRREALARGEPDPGLQGWRHPRMLGAKATQNHARRLGELAVGLTAWGQAIHDRFEWDAILSEALDTSVVKPQPSLDALLAAELQSSLRDRQARDAEAAAALQAIRDNDQALRLAVNIERGAQGQ